MGKEEPAGDTRGTATAAGGRGSMAVTYSTAPNKSSSPGAEGGGVSSMGLRAWLLHNQLLLDSTGGGSTLFLVFGTK